MSIKEVGDGGSRGGARAPKSKRTGANAGNAGNDGNVNGNGNADRPPSSPESVKTRAADTAAVARAIGRTRHPGSPDGQMMVNAVGGAVPVTEWDRLSADSRYEV